ncbi:MAG: hypothetical protein EOM18_10410, partial [Clostridia bacterium]|nr:hypothetical protein [Clostridia bacterium]
MVFFFQYQLRQGDELITLFFQCLYHSVQC